MADKVFCTCGEDITPQRNYWNCGDFDDVECSCGKWWVVYVEVSFDFTAEPEAI